MNSSQLATNQLLALISDQSYQYLMVAEGDLSKIKAVQRLSVSEYYQYLEDKIRYQNYLIRQRKKGNQGANEEKDGF
ncbi:MAG: hypothetical protein AAF734_00055 [Bacteroidota bacterium]